MNGFEEIQKITKNFVEESKQAKQKIVQIESKRNELAQERNKKKNANIDEYKAEINVLGKQISELGNQSQELQNKLNLKFYDVKKIIDIMVDNIISEEIRKVRKINEIREDLEEKIAIREERKAKYEMQKQDFYARFGRMPELSENAQKEDEIQDKQCENYKTKIQEVEKIIEDEEKELVGLADIKKDFANKNWAKIISEEKIQQEEVEETTTLPLTEEIQQVEEFEVEEIEPIEEIAMQEFEPIEEIEVQGFEPIEEIEVQEFEPIEDIKIQEFEVQPFEETNIEKVEENENINYAETIEQDKTDEIEELARAIVEQIVAEQTKQFDEDKEKNQEIIAFEEKVQEETKEMIDENVTLSNIIAKVENGEIVYKAQVSNGEEVVIFPTKLASGNALLKDKEKRENIKEILINYAIAEYRPLDKKIIKKIDPIVCELLNKFAEQYDYDAGSLIYNYAMSFSKNEIIKTDFSNITYNFAYINGTSLSKTEKREISKICRNALKNENVDIVGSIALFSGIKYAFKKLFMTNSVKSLPEGKY